MSDQKKILVIDDSATIRRLADNYLAPEGYQMALASTAEDGLVMAAELLPDLILLDHQLPGTTGYEVCCQLQANEKLRSIPVVISSTLRNKAYVEYANLPNVVDMLPKPYTAELLAMTVKNALDTGAMVVASQTDGTAVPEVIDAPDEAALSGDFSVFALRETLDFLTNTAKDGVLEVEGRNTRMSFYLADGRIQGATASGLNADELEQRLPEDLKMLAPVLRMTVTGAAGNQMQGLVELLDKRVVDGRLLKRMLRYQASELLMRSFEEKLTGFQFRVGSKFPNIVTKLPLEVSTLALLVDGALVIEESRLPAWTGGHCFTRRMSRSHSLDRSGMNTQHVKLAGLSTQPQTLEALAKKHGLELDEARRVLYGLSLGELVESQAGEAGLQIAALGFNADQVEQLRSTMNANPHRGEDWSLHELKDSLALKMLLRRRTPSVLVLNLADASASRTVSLLMHKPDSPLAACRLLGVGNGNSRAPLEHRFELVDGVEPWASVVCGCWGDPLTKSVAAHDNGPLGHESGLAAHDQSESSAVGSDPTPFEPSRRNPSHEAGEQAIATPNHLVPEDVQVVQDADEIASGLDSVELLNKLQAQGLFDN